MESAGTSIQLVHEVRGQSDGESTCPGRLICTLSRDELYLGQIFSQGMPNEGLQFPSPFFFTRSRRAPSIRFHVTRGRLVIWIASTQLRRPPSFPSAVSPTRSVWRSHECGADLWQHMPLLKPLPEDRFFMHVELTLRSQSHVRIHLGLSFLFYPFPVLRTQFGLEQLKPQLLFSLLEFPECCQLCFELAIAHLLGSNPAALVALWRIDIASLQLREEKSVRVLDRLAVPLLRSRNTCIRHIEELL